MYRYLAAAVCLLALSAGAPGADLDLTDPAAAQRLQSDLASPDYAVREAAQQRLATLPPGQLEELRRITATTTDPEAKVRLTARLEEMQTFAFTDPPGLSLKVKDADLMTIASVLSRATGAGFQALGSIPPPAYTLDVDRKPFWEIYRLLYDQSPFGFSNATNALALRSPATAWNHMLIHRGFAMFLQQPQDAPGVLGGPLITYEMRMDLGFDPRIDVATVGAPEFTRLANEFGQPVTTSMPNPTGAPGMHMILMSRRVILIPPPGTRPRTLTMDGFWPVQIAAERQTAEFDDFRQAPAVPLVLGDLTANMTALSLEHGADGNSVVKLALSTTVRGAPVIVPAGTPAALLAGNPRLEIKLLDRAGKILLSRYIPGGVGTNTRFTAPGVVAKMVLSYPSKLWAYKVPFAFKDVPAKPVAP